MSPTSTPPRQRPWAAILAAGMQILPLGSIYAFSVFLRPLEQLLGATRSELATVFGIAAIGYTVGMNLGPRLFRCLGLRVAILLSSVTSALGIGLAANARTFAELALGYGVLFGFGGGIAFVAMQQGVNLLPWRRPGLVNGYLVSLLPCGAMLAAPLFGAGIEQYGVRVTLAALGAVLLGSGAVVVGLVALAGMRTVPSGAGGETAAAKPGRAGLFWRLFAIFFVAAAAGLTVLSQAAGIVAAYGGGNAFALLATTGVTAGIAIARLGGGWLVDRLAIPFVMSGAQAMALAGTILLTVWPSPELCVAALLMIGMGYGIISGATAAAIACYWPKALYGVVAARIYIAWCAAAVTLPLLAAHLFDLTGGYRTAVIVAGAGNLAGALIALTLPRHGATA